MRASSFCLVESAFPKKSFAPLPLEGADERGGVGFPECGSTVSRGQPPPLRGTSFQRKEGKMGCVYRHRYICGEVAT